MLPTFTFRVFSILTIVVLNSLIIPTSLPYLTLVLILVLASPICIFFFLPFHMIFNYLLKGRHDILGEKNSSKEAFSNEVVLWNGENVL